MRVANMCLGVQRIVGDMPVWESRTLYMARVDPYLTAGCEVVLDTVTSQRESLEKVQHYYVRRMLGIQARSMRAVLFSETGLMPIRYRRVLLALKYLLHILDLPLDRLVVRAMSESYHLALRGLGSWFTDMKTVLANLPVPVLWFLPDGGLTRQGVEELILRVERSAEEWIDNVISSSDKTRDLLSDRLEMDGDRLVKKVMTFRHYLRVKAPSHRKALTHLVLSCHELAIERLRWSERRREPVPRQFRVCRFCKDGLEDAVHAVITCPHGPLVILRQEFWTQVDVSLPGFRAKHSEPDVLLRALLAQRVIVSLLAKLAYDVLQIFYAEPIYLYQGGNAPQDS
ncbi:hypothetical protein FPV67DRAFT_1521050 [Lyophyllum atratum]|nr:hypothetical protein FPV67DRAFT_1521050 [Lyophyllum atratum]